MEDQWVEVGQHTDTLRVNQCFPRDLVGLSPPPPDKAGSWSAESNVLPSHCCGWGPTTRGHAVKRSCFLTDIVKLSHEPPCKLGWLLLCLPQMNSRSFLVSALGKSSLPHLSLAVSRGSVYPLPLIRALIYHISNILQSTFATSFQLSSNYLFWINSRDAILLSPFIPSWTLLTYVSGLYPIFMLFTQRKNVKGLHIIGASHVALESS